LESSDVSEVRTTSIIRVIITLMMEAVRMSETSMIITLKMEEVRTSETSVYSNEATRHYIPECSKLYT
jgi:hypothetical protein